MSNKGTHNAMSNKLCSQYYRAKRCLTLRSSKECHFLPAELPAIHHQIDDVNSTGTKHALGISAIPGSDLLTRFMGIQLNAFHLLTFDVVNSDACTVYARVFYR